MTRVCDMRFVTNAVCCSGRMYEPHVCDMQFVTNCRACATLDGALLMAHDSFVCDITHMCDMTQTCDMTHMCVT